MGSYVPQYMRVSMKKKFREPNNPPPQKKAILVGQKGKFIEGVVIGVRIFVWAPN